MFITIFSSYSWLHALSCWLTLVIGEFKIHSFLFAGCLNYCVTNYSCHPAKDAAPKRSSKCPGTTKQPHLGGFLEADEVSEAGEQFSFYYW